MSFYRAAIMFAVMATFGLSASAQNVSFPKTVDGVYVAKNFAFHTGETTGRGQARL